MPRQTESSHLSRWSVFIKMILTHWIIYILKFCKLRTRSWFHWGNNTFRVHHITTHLWHCSVIPSISGKPSESSLTLHTPSTDWFSPAWLDKLHIQGKIEHCMLHFVWDQHLEINSNTETDEGKPGLSSRIEHIVWRGCHKHLPYKQIWKIVYFLDNEIPKPRAYCDLKIWNWNCQ